VGGGGHTRLILERCSGCRVLAVDRDPDALTEARARLAPFEGRVRFLATRFDWAVADAEARDSGLDGALLDLGVSSHQLDADSRGFAFRRGVALDMRMNPSEGVDARSFLAEASEDRLAEAFRDYGEEPRARRLAREVVKRRATAPLETSDDLVAALGVGLAEGDILTRALGQPALSREAVVRAVLQARARRARVLEGEFYRGSERWILRVEQPYLPEPSASERELDPGERERARLASR
jgi:hypothetical protein